MRWVHANDGMELEAAVLAEHDVTNHPAGFFDNAGLRNGGFETLKCADHASTVGESAPDLKELLIDRLFNRPVDCFLCHHD